MSFQILLTLWERFGLHWRWRLFLRPASLSSFFSAQNISQHFHVFKSSSFSASPHSRYFTARWLNSTTFHLKWFLLRNELCWGYQQYIEALDRALKTKVEMNIEHWKWCCSDNDSVDYGADFMGGLRLFTLWGHWPPPMLKFFFFRILTKIKIFHISRFFPPMKNCPAFCDLSFCNIL